MTNEPKLWYSNSEKYDQHFERDSLNEMLLYLWDDGKKLEPGYKYFTGEQYAPKPSQGYALCDIDDLLQSLDERIYADVDPDCIPDGGVIDFINPEAEGKMHEEIKVVLDKYLKCGVDLFRNIKEHRLTEEQIKDFKNSRKKKVAKEV